MKENVLEIKERLRLYLESERFTADKIERKCDCGAGSIHRFLREDGSFSLSNLQKLGEGCPNLNMDWLINGRGSMIYGQTSTSGSELYQISEQHAKQLLVSKEEVNQALIARIKTQEDYLKLLTEKFIKSIDTMLEQTEENTKNLKKISNHGQ